MLDPVWLTADESAVDCAPSTLKPLNSLWIGDELGYLEQLCIASGLAAGHAYRLYSYEPDKLRGVPAGVDLRDAAEIMPRERMIAYAGCNSFALGSNFWRYEMLGKDLGYWVDLDVLLLKPLPIGQDYVFGREPQGTINTAVMLAPADSPLVRDLRTAPDDDRCPSWYGPRRSLMFHWKHLRPSTRGMAHLPWGTYGPEMLTHFVYRNKLDGLAAPAEVFYPIDWPEIRKLYGPAEEVEKHLTDKTLAIHLYNSQLRELAKSPPPVGSYIAKARARLGI